MKTDIPRLLLAAPASGSGKTTVTAGLLRLLQNRGLQPASFKCGPDFIDPLLQRTMLGVPGCNLDLFLAGENVVRGLLQRQAAGRDFALLEGVMGYYDGVAGSAWASSWEVAKATGTPVVLVVSPGGASLSVLATIQGFCRFRSPSMVAGVLFNKCSPGLYQLLAPQVEQVCGVPALGYLPELPGALLKSRKLGLAPPSARKWREKLDLVAVQMEQTVQVERLLALAQTAPPLQADLPDFAAQRQPGVKIALAQDKAFSHYYPENLDLLRQLGAELVPFSPLKDPQLPAGTSGLYLGGGALEGHIPALSQNLSMRRAVARALEQGVPTLAEGAGFLYLQEALQGPDQTQYPMAGALPGRGFGVEKRRRFGYITLTAGQDSLLCARGESLKGHEFHYWDSTCCGDGFTAQKPLRQTQWPCIQSSPNLHGGFPYVYFWSNPQSAVHFVCKAAQYRRKAYD